MPPVSAQAPQLRPRGIGEILAVSMKIVWRNAGTLIRVVIFVVLPVQVVSAVLSASVRPETGSGNTFTFDSTSNQQTISSSDVNAFIGYAFAILVLTLISSTVASGACFRAIASAYVGE